uniref:Uncharacterized protein n=1 Tax=Caenorhabditis japonica TaxID=281687 RepID=A0A8R1DSW4_CAEJA
MSKEGLNFIDKSFNNGEPVDMDGYRQVIKKWLGQDGSVSKILLGVFGNNTKRLQLQSHHVWRPKNETEDS